MSDNKKLIIGANRKELIELRNLLDIIKSTRVNKKLNFFFVDI